MACKSNKIDSNITGLRFLEEACLKELPAVVPAVAASGQLTFSGVGSNGDTITIGAVTYELVSSLTGANDILIGASASATAQNLLNAINAGPGEGTVYGTGTVAHPAVSATGGAAVLTIIADTAGAAGNSIATTDTSTGAAFLTATLTGGADETGADPVWYPLEPNSYSDFGGQIATVARNPINASRQRKKGVTTDLDASGGFNQDITFDNTTRLLQGFFFADMREKFTTAPLNAAQAPITAVVSGTNQYQIAAGAIEFSDVPVGALVFATGFGSTTNNGARPVTASTGTALTVGGTALVAEASPPADAQVRVVGQQFGAAEMDIVMNGSLVRLSRASGTADFTTMGLIPGEWVFLGGDASANRFVNNVGYARISQVAATYLEFDKISWTPIAEVGTGISLRVFFGSVLKNESDPALIKRRSYQLERTLGNDADGQMSEYLVGAVPNELTINIAQADKVTVDLTFVGVDNEQRPGSVGPKAGVRAALNPGSAFNTTSDFSRIKLSLADDDDAAVEPLFAFATELTLSINNNVTPNKAIGVLGAFDTSAGTFEVGGNLTAYFANVEAAQAVRNNSDVTIDIVMAKRNLALLWDIPLLSLGDGRLNVEQDQAITIPLETTAAESKFQHTLLFQSFAYLPDVAGGV